MFTPENDLGIANGYFTLTQFSGLMRVHAGNPDAIVYLAEMLEDSP